jgi:hypothetical protein
MMLWLICNTMMMMMKRQPHLSIYVVAADGKPISVPQLLHRLHCPLSTQVHTGADSDTTHTPGSCICHTAWPILQSHLCIYVVAADSKSACVVEEVSEDDGRDSAVAVVDWVLCLRSIASTAAYIGSELLALQANPLVPLKKYLKMTAGIEP